MCRLSTNQRLGQIPRRDVDRKLFVFHAFPEFEREEEEDCLVLNGIRLPSISRFERTRTHEAASWPPLRERQLFSVKSHLGTEWAYLEQVLYPWIAE